MELHDDSLDGALSSESSPILTFDNDLRTMHFRFSGRSQVVLAHTYVQTGQAHLSEIGVFWTNAF